MNPEQDRSVGEMQRQLYQMLPKGAYVDINYGKTTKGRPSKVRANVYFSDSNKLPIYVQGDTIVAAVNTLMKAIGERT